MDWLMKILSKQNTRIAYLEKDLFTYWLYYFTDIFNSVSADFHKLWALYLMTDCNILLIGFRESAKTVWAMIKLIHNITYKKKRFMIFYCYDKKKAWSKLYDIVIQLQTNKKLMADFGELFPMWVNDDKSSQKKSVNDFITTNEIKVKASSIWESPRWELFFTKHWAFRPDYIVLDDIDVDKSVSNVDIIGKNYLWLKGELMWGLSEDAQILFLWNIIKSDWIVPRFEKDYKNNPMWKISKVPIIENGKITWPERYTLEDLEKKKQNLWEISYNQNFLLIPYSWGDTIIKREQIKYRDTTEMTFDYIQIGTDPAISDIGDVAYILESIELTWKSKDPFNAVQIIKWVYEKYKANKVVVETVAFQQVMAKLLRAEWIAVEEIKPHRDKVTRLLEWQYLFEQWKVFFNPEWTEALVKQLLDFPNVLYDDLVDSMVYSFRKE